MVRVRRGAAISHVSSSLKWIRSEKAREFLSAVMLARLHRQLFLFLPPFRLGFGLALVACMCVAVTQVAGDTNDYCLHRLMIIWMIYRTIFFVINFFFFSG